MADQFMVPDEFESSFRRILPYLAGSLQKNPEVSESLLLYLKLGGEKMARVAIDALNVTQRVQDAEPKKQLREQALELLSDDNRDALNDDEQDEKAEEHEDRLDDEAPC